MNHKDELYGKITTAVNRVLEIDYAATEARCIAAMAAAGSIGGINVMHNPMLPHNTMMVSSDLYEHMQKLATHEIGDKK